MKHLALAVSDQERSRQFYETYFGFDAHPPRRYDDGVLMLYNRDGFSLALGPTAEEIRLPAFLHFGVRLPSADAVREFLRPVLLNRVQRGPGRVSRERRPRRW